MSATKEFYHDELCEMMMNAEEEELNEMILEYEMDREEVEHSGVPSFLCSKF